MTDDNQSPLSMQEAVRAMTQGSGKANPDDDRQDNRAADEDQAQEAPEDEEEDLVAELAEEDQDNPEGDETDGSDEAEEPEPEPYAKGRFAADDARVKLDDGTTTTIAELKKGTLLQSDYTQKTMAVAEERKAVEQQREQVRAVENALAQERELVALLYNRKLPQPPDPAMLDPNSGVFDFLGYTAQKAAYESESQEVQQLIGQHRQMLQRHALEAEAQRRQLRDTEAERLFEAHPDLKEPEAYRKFWAKAVQYGASRGFTAEDLDDVDDHRTYGVLLDAMAYWELKARAKDARSKLNGKPTLLQGSTRRSPDHVRHQAEVDAMARLKKSGSMQDGIAALLAREKVR